MKLTEANHTRGGKCCFPGGEKSKITLKNDEKYVEDIQLGDKLLVRKTDGTITYSPVWRFGHQNRNYRTNFVQIDLESRRIEISRNHFIFTDLNGGAKKAVDFKPGDYMHVYDEEQFCLKPEIVLEARMVDGKGVYAPFTEEGNVFVNGVFCSCYSEVEPSVAHKFMAPFITAQKILPTSVMGKIMAENSEGVPRVFQMAHSAYKSLVVNK